MKKYLFLSLSIILIFVFGLIPSSPSNASTTTWEPVDVISSPFVDTMADGTVVTITFGTAAGYWGNTHPPAYYKTNSDGGVLTSTVRFSFSRSVTKLKTYYAYLGYGDQEEFSTNLGPVNLAQTVANGGNLVSSTGNFVADQPAGTYSSNGIVTSTHTTLGPANSATLELEFPSGITYLEVRGAPSGPGDDGINLTGLELPVTAYTVAFNANGGEGVMNDQTIFATSSITPNTFTREGYAFNGWNTQANGQGTSYANEANVPAADITLYAQWRSTELASTGFNSVTNNLVIVSLISFGGLLVLLSYMALRRKNP